MIKLYPEQSLFILMVYESSTKEISGISESAQRTQEETSHYILIFIYIWVCGDKKREQFRKKPWK